MNMTILWDTNHDLRLFSSSSESKLKGRVCGFWVEILETQEISPHVWHQELQKNIPQISEFSNALLISHYQIETPSKRVFFQ